MKVCSTCQKQLPLEDFYKSKRSRDGRLGQCKFCRRKVNRKFLDAHPGYQRARYHTNRDKILAQQREYQANLSPEAKERVRANRAAYAAEHTEEFRAWKKKWRDANPEYHRNWERNNRELARKHGRKSELKRRSRLRGVQVEDVDPEDIFNRDKGVCGICDTPVNPKDWHLDHIVPLALGGPHVSENLQVSHPYCNLSKGSRLAA